jgi:hypothetical protein
MEKSLLLEESQPGSVYNPEGCSGTYDWNTPCHNNKSKCRKDHNEENDPQGAFPGIVDIFFVIGYYSGLWAIHTVSCGKITRSGTILNLQ